MDRLYADTIAGVVVFVIASLALTLGFKQEILPAAALISGVLGIAAALIWDKLHGG